MTAVPRDRADNFAEDPFHKYLGLTLDDVQPGFARVCLHRSARTPGGISNSVHGGVLAAMVDIAMMQALFPMFGPGDQAAGTADLNITYLRPALGARIFADATVLKKGRQQAVVEVSIIDEQGRLCSKGRTIYAIRAR